MREERFLCLCEREIEKKERGKDEKQEKQREGGGWVLERKR
jgi:hypothetical protein